MLITMLCIHPSDEADSHNEQKDEIDNQQSDHIKIDYNDASPDLPDVSTDTDQRSNHDEIEEIQPEIILDHLYQDPIYHFEILNQRNGEEMNWNKQHMIHNQRLDPILKIIINYINDEDIMEEHKDLPPKQKGDVVHNKYFVGDDGLLYFKHTNSDTNLIVLPVQQRKALLAALHDDLLSGNHAGISYTQNKVMKYVYWHGYMAQIAEYIRTCRACQLSKAKQHKSHGLMQLFRATRPNQHISIDHAVMPTTPDGNKYITSIIDNYSGLVYAAPMPDISASRVARLIHDKWITVHGVPDKLLSDQGKELIGEIMKHLCKMCKITKLQTSSYNPRTNGQVERWNGTMKKGLRCIAHDTQLSFIDGYGWDLFIDLLSGHFNNQISRRHTLSPNEVHYGYNTVLPFEYNIEKNEFKYDSQQKILYATFIRICKRIRLNMASEYLTKYDIKRKEYYDKKRIEYSYKIGTQVIYLSKSLKIGSEGKLTSLWKGPYIVVKKYDDMKYKIQHYHTKEKINVTVDRIHRYHVRDEGMFDHIHLDNNGNDLFIELHSDAESDIDAVRNAVNDEYDRLNHDSDDQIMDAINDPNEIHAHDPLPPINIQSNIAVNQSQTDNRPFIADSPQPNIPELPIDDDGELNNTQNNNDSDNSNSSDDENQKVSGRKRKRSEILDEEMDITVMEPTSKRLKQFYINLIRRHYS